MHPSGYRLFVVRIFFYFCSITLPTTGLLETDRPSVELVQFPTAPMKFPACGALTGTLQNVTDADCATLLQQARRLGFQKLPQAQPSFTDATALTIAAWNTLTAAVDDTKIVTPKKKLYGPELTSTEAVNVGSNDNSTPDGASILVGQTIPMFRFNFNGLTPEEYEDVEDLFSWGNKSVDFPTLGAYIFCGDRQVIMSKDFGPVPIRAPFIGDPTGAQLHTLTLFPGQFELEKGWFRNVKVLTLNFNHSLLSN